MYMVFSPEILHKQRESIVGYDRDNSIQIEKGKVNLVKNHKMKNKIVWRKVIHPVIMVAVMANSFT